MPNQEPASAWIFGNSSVRVGTRGLFRPCLKTFVPPFLPTRLTAPGSPRMHTFVQIVLIVQIVSRNRDNWSDPDGFIKIMLNRLFQGPRDLEEMRFGSSRTGFWSLPGPNASKLPKTLFITGAFAVLLFSMQKAKFPSQRFFHSRIDNMGPKLSRLNWWSHKYCKRWAVARWLWMVQVWSKKANLC